MVLVIFSTIYIRIWILRITEVLRFSTSEITHDITNRNNCILTKSNTERAAFALLAINRVGFIKNKSVFADPYLIADIKLGISPHRISCQVLEFGNSLLVKIA